MIAHILLALFFAYCTGRHDVSAVDNFTYHGSNVKHQAQFHKFNWLLKACFVLAISFNILFDTSDWNYVYTGEWKHALCTGISNAMIIFAVFDPVVAIWRTIYTPPKKPWYYLSPGTPDKDGKIKGHHIDRALLNAFGPKAGIYKFIGALIIAAAANIVNYFL